MNLMTNVAEQRRHPRVVCSLVGTIREMESARLAETLGDLHSKNTSVVLHDISLGGVCLRTDQVLTLGNIMRLEFALPAHGFLATFAEVCWINGGKIGMKFLALPEKGAIYLRNFILHEDVIKKMHDLEGRKK
jgi:hypothetical protein